MLSLAPFISGLKAPVDFQIADDNSGRIFVVEQAGRIRIVSNGALASASLLDITSRVTSGGELGLLGVAFHPNYAQNSRFYVNYTRTVGGQIQTVIAEYSAPMAAANQVDPATERILLVVDQPFPNHKAGQLAFGSDGFLYFGLGDGGSGGDPNGNGQNVNVLLGKMMRIDVDHTSTGLQYAIPPGNPFASGGGRAEIWAWGFRNPWRFSFDRVTNRQFVADVGQDNFEEVNIVTGGANYGWNTMEGDHCFHPATGCNMAGLTLPILEYSHAEGSAVIGGYVYRGGTIPSLQGTYVFTDLSGGKLWGATENSGTWTRNVLMNISITPSAFGQDAAGELYILDYGNGAILKLVGS